MNDKNFSELIRDFFGILFVALTLFSLLSLATYSTNDPSFNSAVSGKARVINLGGLVGAYISDALVQMFGTGAFFFPILTLILGWAFIRGKQFRHWPWVLCSGVLFLVSLCALSAALLNADLFFGKEVQTGGMAGSVLGSFLVHWLNKGGAVLVLATFMLLALLGMTGISVGSLVDGTRDAVAGMFRLALGAGVSIRESFGEWREQARKERLEREEEEFEEFEEEERRVTEPIIVSSSPPPLIIQPVKKNSKNIEEEFEEEDEDEEEFYVDEEELLPDEESDEYYVPPASLLEDPPEHEDPEEMREEILANSAVLEQKLADFGVQGRVVQVLPGPVITLFEYEPAPGIKVSRILGLSDDLALAMRATSLRILAPVPGKPVVGIEIPNTKKETVYFKEIINCDDFMESESVLPLAIGKDNIGQPVVQDLATIPHLLMAGSTGSGKSVGMNAMICSILLNASPDEVKMIMIDPKMLELSIYDGLPHLIAPVVTNPKKAAGALQWAVAEMEARYKMMAEAGVRNIKGFNEHVETLEEEYEEKILAAEKLRRKKPKSEDDDEEEDEIPEPPMKLPYIVILIDELADLMMVAGKGVEECLTRLAQMARAAGIHLIVATQRPSVDVLTGIIKANFPARIAYKVISRVDSRTILDSMGADKLLGKGDMLFLPPGTSRLLRIHGCMVSDEEINRIVGFIKKQQAPDYEENIFDSVVVEEEAGEEEEEYDEKYDEAVALVAKERQASISYIQRRMRIGYNRAARIVECMEREGVVGPSDGVRPREVYVKPILLEE